MPIEAKWLNDKQQVLHFHLTGRWTWAEYRHVLFNLQWPQHPLVTLYTFDNTSYLPTNTLSALMTLYKPGIPQIFRRSYIVGHHALLKANLSIIRNLSHNVDDRYFFEPSLESALYQIDEYLRQLADQQTNP